MRGDFGPDVVAIFDKTLLIVEAKTMAGSISLTPGAASASGGTCVGSVVLQPGTGVLTLEPGRGKTERFIEALEHRWNVVGTAAPSLPRQASVEESVEEVASGGERSWWDLASFFLSRELREIVRGDLHERRIDMATRGYRRIWIEAATVVELIRSMFGAWGGTLKTVIVEIVKRVVT